MEGCAGVNKKASPTGRHQEQTSKQRYTFSPNSLLEIFKGVRTKLGSLDLPLINMVLCSGQGRPPGLSGMFSSVHGGRFQGL